VLGTASLAQTSTDDQPAAEGWWDRVGAGFFSDPGLVTLRPDLEIRAHWTALSADDQAAVKARCGALAKGGSGASASNQQGSNTGVGGPPLERSDDDSETNVIVEKGVQAQPETDGSDQTSITGAVEGTEVQRPAEGVTGYTGLAGDIGDETQVSSVCDVISKF